MSLPIDPIILAAGIGVVALLYALILVKHVLSQDPGSKAMTDIADAVKQGANAFLKREYRTIAPIAAIITVILALAIDPVLAIGFVIGATLSALAGFIGMALTVRTSSRTAQAATKGMGHALTIAFRGGSVMGMSVTGLALLAVSLFYLAFSSRLASEPLLLAGLGFGASLIAMFMRVSGGIYTKAADVGADLVGKIEAGMPEDDPRNPAVIADNVGDNVGDCAGMGADIYESYVVTLVAAVLLGTLIMGNPMVGAILGRELILLPFLIGVSGLVGSIIGGFYLRSSLKGDPMSSLNTVLFISVIIAGILNLVFAVSLFPSGNLGYALFASSIVGMLVAIVIQKVADYYTSYNYKPVKFIAESSKTGPATNFLAGYAVGLGSTFPSALVLVVAIIVSFTLGTVFSGGIILMGVYSTAIATMAMLSLTAVIMSIDAFGPITDNANGIVEMAGLPEEIRDVTDRLDAVGNTTKATTKGFAIASAALAALALFQVYQLEAGNIIARGDAALAAKYANVFVDGNLLFLLSSPTVIVGLLIGGLLPFFFSSFLIQAVGRAANEMVIEVRRQFKEMPGILKGTTKPDYAKCVDISTKAAIRELLKPALLAICTPLIVGFILGPLALGGLLIGSVVSGVYLAFMMANGGAAWDNAKKYIELGNFGGKNSDAHSAAIMGDTVGDPFKDTAGPAINPLIKVLNTISVVFVTLIVVWGLAV